MLGKKRISGKSKMHLKKLGQSPGTLTFVGEQKQDTAMVKVVNYDANRIEESDESALTKTAAECEGVTWVDVAGLHDLKLIERLGALFSIHSLALEDVLNTQHRPKIEDMNEYLFFVVKNGSWKPDKTVGLDQATLILGANVVVTFREREDGVFDGVRSRLKSTKGRIRSRGADYLACALIDACVDRFYLVTDGASEEVVKLEEELLMNPDPDRLKSVHALKMELNRLRRTVWPMREVTAELIRRDFDHISDETIPFFRDVHDHVVQVLETVETLHDNLSGLMDLYLSGMSHRMNEVMKVLTVMASLFIPLTFVAGVYGMNFDYMPELSWHWSYPVFWIVILLLAGTLLAFFKRKGWF